MSLIIWPAAILFKYAHQRECILEDLSRWVHKDPKELSMEDFARVFRSFSEFRSLFYHRIGGGRSRIKTCLLAICRFFWPPQTALFLHTQSIGPGLFINHGFATIISAISIGRNCFIHQQVTIGVRKAGDEGPKLGDEVYVGAGAKILGNIRIGHRASIGANAVVICDIPDDCTAVGVPARIIQSRKA